MLKTHTHMPLNKQLVWMTAPHTLALRRELLLVALESCIPLLLCLGPTGLNGRIGGRDLQ